MQSYASQNKKEFWTTLVKYSILPWCISMFTISFYLKVLGVCCVEYPATERDDTFELSKEDQLKSPLLRSELLNDSET